jgi:uncharacterized tellurite resistance protein B-like protein
MKTNISNIVPFIAVSIWADGVYEEVEKETLSEIADALELDEQSFVKEVEEYVEKIKDASEEEVNSLLSAAGEAVADDERFLVFEVVLEMILCDRVMTREESENLVAMAEALKIEMADALLLVADMVKSEPEMDIEL